MAVKMKYEKPMIAVENFELSQAIAACSTKVSFNSSDCVKHDSDLPDQYRELGAIGYFLERPGCTYTAIGMDEYDNICYHSSVNLMFTS